MKMILRALLAAFIGYVVYGFIKISRQFYKRFRKAEKIPGPPIEHRLLGHPSLALLEPKDIPKTVYQQYKEFGGIFRHWYAWVSFVFVAEANYAELYFTSKSLEEKADMYKLFHDWLGQGLITSNGALWHERRKLITPAFHFNVLNALHETLVQNAIALVQKLREHPKESPLNIYTVMHLVALDNICESAMGIKIDALNNPKLDYIQAVEDAAHAIAIRIGKPWFWNGLFYLTSTGRTLTSSLKKIFELAKKAILNSKNKKTATTEEQRAGEDDGIKVKRRLAFLDLLTEAHDSGTKPLSDEGLRDEVNTFIFAGHDTTATSLSFTLFLLGIHPDVQEKCYREMNDIFQGSDRKPTVDDLKAMKYLEQVIKESLRMYPSVPLISRKVKEDVQFGKYTIPEGATVALSIYCLHRDPKYFPNPNTFDPERFNSDNNTGRHPFAYVPFAAGVRNCIGQKFALMEEKIVVSYILRNFIIESLYGMDELELSFDLVLRSQKPLDVKLKPRSTNIDVIKI
ncbi:cytochrome P450 4V2 [Bemisia tabaci]